MDANSLPDDVEVLKKMIFQKDQELSRLQDIINLLQRKKYAPQSEVVPSNQLGLFNELEEIIAEDEKDETAGDEKETITYERTKNRRPRIPDDLPREEVTIDLPEAEKFCPHDGTALKRIGEDVSEQLEIIPAKVFVKKTIRPKYACPCCQEGVKCSPPPVVLLPKSMASSSLIAYIITAKFMDALPLYRQEVIFARIGALLTRQSMARWLIDVSAQLVPLYNLLQERLLERTYLQMDETRIQVLNEKDRKATTKSYMWVRYSPEKFPIVLYDYSPTRASTNPKKLLEGFKGYLQVDGYDGYAPFFTENPGVTRLGCMDHARRKFKETFDTSAGKGVGRKALIYFKKLYDLEDKFKDGSDSDRHMARHEVARPILDEMNKWLDEMSVKTTPNSVGGKAINYALNEWPYLIGYLNDGRLKISNAFVENSIRPFAIGRKNWLFSASVDGADASAMFYSLVETAKANDLEPFDYFSRMLDKLPHAKTADDFEALLPFKGNF